MTVDGARVAYLEVGAGERAEMSVPQLAALSASNGSCWAAGLWAAT